MSEATIEDAMTQQLSPELEAELSVPRVMGAEHIVAVTGGGYWPTLMTLPGGALAAVVRGGAAHVGLHSRLDLARSADGGRTWTVSNIIPACDRCDNRGSAAGAMSDGSIVVGYWECTNYRGEKFDTTAGGLSPFFVRSADGGQTWSPPACLVVAPLAWAVFYGRIVTMSDGSALMPIYGAMPKEEVCWSAFLRSRDGGRSWGEVSLIARGFNETSLLAMPDGRVLAFMRCDTGRAVGTWQSESANGGRTWSAPRELTGPHQHPADACLLAGGDVLLTYGNRIGELAVGAMLSRDGGRSWDRPGRVVLADGAMTLRGKTWGDVGYPSTVQLDDGTIVTMYYRLGSKGLSPREQEICRQYERDTFERPPASQDMRRFEQAVVVRYREKQLTG
jgi:hypothetical protein